MSSRNRGGRPAGDKTRCGGLWTEAKYNSFIRSLIRSGTRKWAPINNVQKKARVARGFYRCAGCGEDVPLKIQEGMKRVQNIFVDHIQPAVDPEIGFTNWDDFIARLYCEEENLQVLCKQCHDLKSSDERAVAVERRRKEKE